MKKYISILVAIMLALLCMMPAFAAEKSVSVCSTTIVNKFDSDDSTVDNSTMPPTEASDDFDYDEFSETTATHTGFTSDTFVFDDADFLTDDEESELNTYLQKKSEKAECGIYVLTQDYFTSIEDEDEEFYSDNDLGYGEDYDGVLIAIDLNERYVDFYCKYGKADYALGSYRDEMLEAFSDCINDEYVLTDYELFNGLKSCAAYCAGMLINSDYSGIDYEYDHDYSYSIGGTQYNPVTIGIICVVVGFILALIVTMIMKNKNKSVHFAKTAANYEKPGSFNIRFENDSFLYHTVTRTPIPKNTDHGGGGGHVGGGGGGGGGSHGGGHF